MTTGQHKLLSPLSDYHPEKGVFDELNRGNGPLPDYWQSFFAAYQQLSPEELSSRYYYIQRLMKENGVTYNVYSDPVGRTRTWQLDSIPAIISPAEWANISSGLIQRAHLLDLLLKDIYGRQQLLHDRIIPPELILAHPGFLRPCMGLQIPGKHYLPLYSADMARSLDGRLWVLGDRTQAPSGSGYALENRLVMSRALPEFFHPVQVMRIGSYFNAVYNALAGLGNGRTDNPKIIVLTPGPGNETYFEHAYLASFLGLSLVQGNDLMVKGDFLWLKTLGGLEKVDVILRRVDDVYCDPLELKSDSLLGVPGLLHVLRMGHVAIANPLGSGVVENPGLVPFLPHIASYFGLGDLRLPSLATWWCGQPRELDYVMKHLSSLVIKKIYRSPGTSVYDIAALSPAKIETLKARIYARPYLYVAQEKVNFAVSPATIEDSIRPSHSVFRSFLVSAGDGYSVMPGGLTRTGKKEKDVIISNQLGGLSKDTWVLSDHPDDNLPVLRREPSGLSGNRPGALPSHTGESLFWVGRYAERVINNARLQRTVMQFISQPGRQSSPYFGHSELTLLRALTNCTYTYPGFIEMNMKEIKQNPWPELRSLLFEEKRSGTLGYNLSLFRNTVFSVREFWSMDIWRVMHNISEDWAMAKKKKPSSVGYVEMIDIMDRLVISLYAFLGLNRESSRRVQGWVVFDLGRKIEQCLSATMLIQSVFTHKKDEKQEYDYIETILTCNQCLNIYRYTYRDYLQLPLMLNLLLQDRDNPRSLAYLLGKLREYVESLPHTENKGHFPELQIKVKHLLSLLQNADSDALCVTTGPLQNYAALQELMEKMQSLLIETAELISKIYFKHTEVQKQLFTSEVI